MFKSYLDHDGFFHYASTKATNPKRKGPDGTKILSKGACKHTFDQSSHTYTYVTTKLNGYGRKRSVKTTKFLRTMEEQARERQQTDPVTCRGRETGRKKRKKKPKPKRMSVLVALASMVFLEQLPGVSKAAWMPQWGGKEVTLPCLSSELPSVSQGEGRKKRAAGVGASKSPPGVLQGSEPHCWPRAVLWLQVPLCPLPSPRESCSMPPTKQPLQMPKCHFSHLLLWKSHLLSSQDLSHSS